MVYALRLIARHPYQFREAYGPTLYQLGADGVYLEDGEYDIPVVIVEVSTVREYEAIVRFVARLAHDLLSYEAPHIRR